MMLKTARNMVTAKIIFPVTAIPGNMQGHESSTAKADDGSCLILTYPEAKATSNSTNNANGDPSDSDAVADE